MEEVEGPEEELDSSSSELEDEDEPPGFGLLTPGVKTGDRIAHSDWKISENLPADPGHTSIKEPPIVRTFALRVKELRIPLTSEYRFYRRNSSRSNTVLPL